MGPREEYHGWGMSVISFKYHEGVSCEDVLSYLRRFLGLTGVNVGGGGKCVVGVKLLTIVFPVLK